jgi:PAS domain S-box-containing protein
MDVERQRYRELLEVVSHGYLITDPDGVIREANDGVAALMDVHPELLLGRSLLDFVAEDGRQDLRERIKHFLQVDGGSVQQWQSTLQPPGQAAFPPLSLSSPGEDPEGQTANLYWLLYDLTDRAETARALQISEARHQTLIEGLNDMLFVVDSAGCLTYVSPAVERIGYYQAREIIGQPRSFHRASRRLVRLFV